MRDAERDTGDAHRAFLCLRNRFEDLQALEGWLQDAAQRFSFPPRTVFCVDLILNEALPNIISYAYRDDEPHAIAITLHDHDDSVVIEVVDDGLPFDPFARRECAPAPDLESARCDGRGILLMKSFSDAQEYRREQGRNIVRLRVPKSSASMQQSASAVA